MINIKKIDEICKKYNIENYVINKDGSIDVYDNVDLSRKNLKFLPLKFNIIKGYCDLSFNSLSSLKNSPVYVGGDFSSSNNQTASLKYSPKEVKKGFIYYGDDEIKTLKHGPEKVIGSYYCHRNDLVSLEGEPKRRGNIKFDCSYNNLINLKYSPKEIKGGFNCNVNKLKTLEYGPERVYGDYECCDNHLIMLKGAPKIIHGNFCCWSNKLKTLEYGPERVYGDYKCMRNKLKNLKGCAKHIRGILYVSNNPNLYTFEGLMYCEVKCIDCENTIFYNVWKLFSDVSKIELFNEMDIIREDVNGKPVIILDRLNEFLDIIGKPTVEKVEGYINI